MEEEKQFLNVKEAARLLDIHPFTLCRLAKQGKVPGHKIGQKWRFDRGVIEDLIKWRAIK